MSSVFSFLFSDWIYDEKTVGETNPKVEGPKLEDFLGSCYSNSSPNDSEDYCETQQEGINVNLPPIFNHSAEEMEAEGNLNLTNSATPFLQPYNHYNDNPQNGIPSAVFQRCDLNFNPNNGNAMTHVPFYGANSISGFKSWLRETPVYGEKPAVEADSDGGFRPLSLTMRAGINPGVTVATPLQSVDGRKRPAVKSINREAVGRKSTGTFGQRTSQYRGVTRYSWKTLNVYRFFLVHRFGPEPFDAGDVPATYLNGYICTFVCILSIAFAQI